MHTTAPHSQAGTPPPSAGSYATLDRLDDGFAPPDPSVSQETWLEAARTSSDPAMRAFHAELVLLAGGRTDIPALTQVLDRYHAVNNAVTASEVQAAERGWLDQVGSMIDRLDPVGPLLNAVQPHIADLVRSTGAGNTEWGASLQAVLDNPGTLSALRSGLRQGMLEGAKDLVVGTLSLAGKAVRYSADVGPLGHAGDWLRERTGLGVLDSVVPSADRGAAATAAMGDMAGKVGEYIGSVASDPGRLKGDIAGAISAQWDNLKGAHAAAAAQGPEAEARWWGETVGRVTFEVAATFVPVAGQVGKGTTAIRVAENAADVAGDAVRKIDRMTDTARAISLAERTTDFVAPLDVGTYKQLSARSVGDGLTPDHIPSFAAIRESIENQIGRKLTPTQLRELRNETTSIVYDTVMHQQHSRTYGGRNNRAQIASDALNLRGAAELDMRQIRPHLIEGGMAPDEIERAFAAIHDANVANGLYK